MKKIDLLVEEGKSARVEHMSRLVDEAREILGGVDSTLFQIVAEAGAPYVAPDGCWSKTEGRVTWPM